MKGTHSPASETEGASENASTSGAPSSSTYVDGNQPSSAASPDSESPPRCPRHQPLSSRSSTQMRSPVANVSSPSSCETYSAIAQTRVKPASPNSRSPCESTELSRSPSMSTSAFSTPVAELLVSAYDALSSNPPGTSTYVDGNHPRAPSSVTPRHQPESSFSRIHTLCPDASTSSPPSSLSSPSYAAIATQRSSSSSPSSSPALALANAVEAPASSRASSAKPPLAPAAEEGDPSNGASSTVVSVSAVGAPPPKNMLSPPGGLNARYGGVATRCAGSTSSSAIACACA